MGVCWLPTGHGDPSISFGEKEGWRWGCVECHQVMVGHYDPLEGGWTWACVLVCCGGCPLLFGERESGDGGALGANRLQWVVGTVHSFEEREWVDLE